MGREDAGIGTERWAEGSSGIVNVINTGRVC